MSEVAGLRVQRAAYGRHPAQSVLRGIWEGEGGGPARAGM